MQPTEPGDRHRPRVLAQNVVVALGGMIAPALVAVAAMPILASRLGPERLGVLAIVWSVVGYFSLLDLGIGRALTNRVAVDTATGDHATLPGVVATAGAMLLALGILGALVAVGLASWFARSLLDVPAELRSEVEWSIRLVALNIPALTLSAGARGVVEARQRFGLVNAVRVPVGVLMYGGPLLVLPFTRSVLGCVGVLAAVRIAAAVVLVALCMREVPGLIRVRRLSREAFTHLSQTGAWMTLANLASSFTG